MTKSPNQVATNEEHLAATVNRAAVHLAAQKRLVESWFPSLGKSDDAQSGIIKGKAQENPIRNGITERRPGLSPQQELALEARSERLGLGATPINDWKDGPATMSMHNGSKELETLRRQVLGQRKSVAGSNGVRSRHAPITARHGLQNSNHPMPRRARDVGSSSDSEEEVGRASTVGKASRVRRSAALSKDNPYQQQPINDSADHEPRQKPRVAPLQHMPDRTRCLDSESVVNADTTAKIPNTTIDQWYDKSEQRKRRKTPRDIGKAKFIRSEHNEIAFAPDTHSTGDSKPNLEPHMACGAAGQSDINHRSEPTFLASTPTPEHQAKGGSLHSLSFGMQKAIETQATGHSSVSEKSDPKREKKRREKLRRKEKKREANSIAV